MSVGPPQLRGPPPPPAPPAPPLVPPLPSLSTISRMLSGESQPAAARVSMKMGRARLGYRRSCIVVDLLESVPPTARPVPLFYTRERAGSRATANQKTTIGIRKLRSAGIDAAWITDGGLLVLSGCIGSGAPRSRLNPCGELDGHEQASRARVVRYGWR